MNQLTLMLLMATAEASGDNNPFMTMVEPIVKLLNSVITPALVVVGALGSIFCILLGVKYAKAEEPQDREKAKNSLKNAIIGFVLIFVLLVALQIGLPAMMSWYEAEAGV